MATSDLDNIAQLTAQLAAVQQQANAQSSGPAKDLLNAQVVMLTAQLTATAQHAQQQADSNSNFLNDLGLFSTLQSTVGNLAPSILSLFKK